MSEFRFFNTHRPWEDWFGMLLGVLIVVSPWFPFQTHDIVGFLIRKLHCGDPTTAQHQGIAL